MTFLYIRNRAVSAGNVIEHADGTCELVPIEEYYRDFPKYSKICRNANSMVISLVTKNYYVHIKHLLVNQYL